MATLNCTMHTSRMYVIIILFVRLFIAFFVSTTGILNNTTTDEYNF